METPDAIESSPARDEVFVVRVRVEHDAGRSRVTVRHVGSGRHFTSEQLDDVGDFIRLIAAPETGVPPSSPS